MTKEKHIRILIIEDDPYFRIGLKDYLKDYGIIEEASNAEEGTLKLQSNFYDLALIDMQLQGQMAGLSLVSLAKKKGVHNIVLSSTVDETITEIAYNNGCNHFLSKLKYKTELETYIHQYLEASKANSFENFIAKEYITTDSELISKIKELTLTNLKNKTLFITGETGVGKSLIGKHLHHFIYKKDAPFVHLNCSEISENLMEAELFGYVKGAFTGAISDKKGKLELASHGTLFLDEIATMPLSMQQKLLKALDEKSFYPVGSTTPKKLEFTLITATCEDIFSKIQKGEFRKDLFYRICGFSLDIKPLRERKQDIHALIHHFLNESPRRFVIKEEALDSLIQYPWEGNIRELKKTIEMLSLKSKGVIYKEDLPESLQFQTSLETSGNNLLTKTQKEFIYNYGLKDFIAKIEQEMTKESLKRNQGKITQCIKELQISTSSFYRIFNELKV